MSGFVSRINVEKKRLRQSERWIAFFFIHQLEISVRKPTCGKKAVLLGMIVMDVEEQDRPCTRRQTLYQDRPCTRTDHLYQDRPVPGRWSHSGVTRRTSCKRGRGDCWERAGRGGTPPRGTWGSGFIAELHACVVSSTFKVLLYILLYVLFYILRSALPPALAQLYLQLYLQL